MKCQSLFSGENKKNPVKRLCCFMQVVAYIGGVSLHEMSVVKVEKTLQRGLNVLRCT